MMMTASEFALLMTGVCGVSPGSHVLAAVSGGRDSTALLCLLCEVKERLCITVSCAHVEHGIRGDASVEDMAFVRALCEQKHIPFYARRVDVPAYARSHAMGLEDAARTLRHGALREIAQEIGADVIALAHHAQDQAETVLMHAARGCDVRGLCAMRWRSGQLIRPLLGVMPQALGAYLQALGQPWREDATNLDVSYARSRIRHEALPSLEKAYPGTVGALCRLAAAAQRDEDYFERLLEGMDVKRKALVDGVALDTAALAGLEEALLGRLIERELQKSGFGVQASDVIEGLIRAILHGCEDTLNLTGGAHACVTGGYLCLIRARSHVEDTPLDLCGETITPFGVFSVRPAADSETGDGIVSQAFDEETLCGAVVSQRRDGDTMVPFGRKSPVKLKKLMIDAGIPRPIRNSLPVIRRSGNEQDVLWAVGLRPSNRCEMRTGRRLMLIYKSN